MASSSSPSGDAGNTENSLTVRDNRTGKEYTIPLIEGRFVAAPCLALIGNESDPDAQPVQSFDPGFMNTAIARSKISYVGGTEGVLLYRGYRIEDLVEHSTFLEVAFLLIYGELPTPEEHLQWSSRITRHTYLHENLVQHMKTFRYDAHPMGMLISSMSALSTFYPEANPALAGAQIFDDPKFRNKQFFRILGKLPTIAAATFRHRIGRPYNEPCNDLSYVENFMYMLDKLNESNYMANPKLVKALDIIFILHAEHEMNCSTGAMRHVSSSLVDPYTAVASAAGALYGPLHGGANEAVLRMLREIGSPDNIPDFLDQVKQKKRRLMGFGHRIYKSYDPRATIMKKVAEDVFEVVGRTPLMDVAIELEKAALEDDYFISRKLYPNLDFYSGVIFHAMGFPTDMFPVMFVIPRVAGWLAHWQEGLDEPEKRIYRPRQIYCGEKERKYVPVEERSNESASRLTAYSTGYSARRDAGMGIK